AWAREAGYDGIQLPSSNARFIHQFLSPYYNRRTDEFGGSVRNRARILELLAQTIRREAGEDYPLTAKIPIGEDAPPLSRHTTFDEGIELCRLAEAFGYDAITPVGLSVFPHGSLCRGAYPSSIPVTKAHKERFDWDLEPMLSESSNRCLPAQQIGMRSACYNPNVARKRAERKVSARAAGPPAGP